MKIKIDGGLNEYYVQTLCLMYFPGSKFSNKTSLPGEPEVHVTSRRVGAGYEATVALSVGGRVYTGECVVGDAESLSRPQMAEKSAVGKAFLEAGGKAFGYTPPWGILTGVRPSKLAMSNIENGYTFDANVNAFMSDFALDRDKAILAVKVAEAEKRLITKELYNECSVYIAIPFCPTRCSYCSFVSFTSEKLLSLIPEYLEALIKDIEKRAALIKKLGIKVTTVYIGGGTPTVLNENQLEKLLDAVCRNFDVSSLHEFTLEAGRPDTITKEKLRMAFEHGVTRISVNTQTLNDEILSSIGRHHTSEDFFTAYSVARESGIQNINVDLIAGLPGESAESFADTVDRIAALSPENVTVHTFCVKKSADIRQSDPDVYKSVNDVAAESVAYSQKKLGETGYFPYYMYRQKNAMGNLENVGFTKQGCEGLYNIFMMEEIQSIFACGASAVSKLVHVAPDGKVTIERMAENKYPFEYLAEKNGSDADSKESEYEEKVLSFYKEHYNMD